MGIALGNDKTQEQGRFLYNLPKDREELAPTPPEHFEFIVLVKENSKPAALAVMEGFYRIVFD